MNLHYVDLMLLLAGVIGGFGLQTLFANVLERRRPANNATHRLLIQNTVLLTQVLHDSSSAVLAEKMAQLDLKIEDNRMRGIRLEAAGVLQDEKMKGLDLKITNNGDTSSRIEAANVIVAYDLAASQARANATYGPEGAAADAAARD